MCKLFRLVKLLKLKVLEDLENSGHVSPSLIRVGKLFFTFILVAGLIYELKSGALEWEK